MTTRSSVWSKWPYLLVVPLGLWLDLWSKAEVFAWLRIAESHVVVEDFFWIEPVENPGGLWGVGKGMPWILVAARLVAIPVLLLFAWRIPGRERLLHWALALVMAGALGNIYDNLWNVPEGVAWGVGEGERLGAVRDFLKFKIPVIDYSWPTFNVADMMIVSGAILLAITAFFSGSREGAEEKAEGAAGEGPVAQDGTPEHEAHSSEVPSPSERD